jgi:hypothetical protein
MQKEKNIKSRWSKNILLFVLNPSSLSLFSPLRFIQIGHFRLWREKREIERERELLEMFGGVRSESEKCGFMCGRAAENEKKIVGVMNMHKV